MDLSDPTRAVTSTLDGPVLAALARSGRPLTVGEVAAQAVRGSEIGIRRSLARLTEQGIVIAMQMGRNQVHELNREHLAAPIADALAGLRSELWARLRALLAGWDPAPLYACVFGSAARGDGGPDSDIDAFVVHPPFPGEVAIPGRILDTVAAALPHINTLTPATPEREEQWETQVEQLHDRVFRWTGNALQVLDVSAFQWWSDSEPELFAEIAETAVTLAGAALLPQRRSGMSHDTES
jgi:DNA-binding transcriptional ArsR family regulator